MGRTAERLVAAGAAPTAVATAAWLHDVGYSPVALETGFHALDGAVYLRRHGWPDEVVNLVAHHTGARFEAAERGLLDALREFPEPDRAALDALSLADLTTSPSGLPTTVDDRIREILARYPETHAVHRAVVLAEPHLRAAIARAERPGVGDHSDGSDRSARTDRAERSQSHGGTPPATSGVPSRQVSR